MIEQITIPALNSLWKHSRGATYQVLLITNEATDKPSEYPITVVYQDVENKKIWSRTLSRWYESMSLI